MRALLAEAKKYARSRLGNKHGLNLIQWIHPPHPPLTRSPFPVPRGRLFTSWLFAAKSPTGSFHSCREGRQHITAICQRLARWLLPPQAVPLPPGGRLVFGVAQGGIFALAIAMAGHPQGVSLRGYACHCIETIAGKDSKQHMAAAQGVLSCRSAPCEQALLHCDAASMTVPGRPGRAA